MWSHQQQLLRYVGHVFEQLADEVGSDAGVSHGVIYPKPPETPGLREEVERLLDGYGVPATGSVRFAAVDGVDGSPS